LVVTMGDLTVSMITTPTPVKILNPLQISNRKEYHTSFWVIHDRELVESWPFLYLESSSYCYSLLGVIDNVKAMDQW